MNYRLNLFAIMCRRRHSVTAADVSTDHRYRGRRGSTVEQPWNINGEQTDQWGYTRYSLALHTPPDLHQTIMDFRAAIGLADLTSEPHISVSSTLYLPTDLDSLRISLRDAARQVSGFFAPYKGPPVDVGGGLGWIPVLVAPELEALRTSMLAVTDGQVQSVPPKSDRGYRPHITLYQDASEDEADRGRTAFEQFDFGSGFDISSIELVGRVGPPRGGSRQIIESYPFSK